jgi:rRNA maturation RNase YbeY
MQVLLTMPLELAAIGIGTKIPRANLRAQALALLKLCDLEDYELSLLLTDDRTMRRLNRRFRGQDRPTDVLAFPQMDLPPRPRSGTGRRKRRMPPFDSVPPPLGDVVISLDTARRQARALGVTLPSRIRTLLIHGFLHLLGYDHEKSAREARRMFKREDELQRRLDLMDSHFRRAARIQ